MLPQGAPSGTAKIRHPLVKSHHAPKNQRGQPFSCIFCNPKTPELQPKFYQTWCFWHLGVKIIPPRPQNPPATGARRRHPRRIPGRTWIDLPPQAHTARAGEVRSALRAPPNRDHPRSILPPRPRLLPFPAPPRLCVKNLPSDPRPSAPPIRVHPRPIPASHSRVPFFSPRPIPLLLVPQAPLSPRKGIPISPPPALSLNPAGRPPGPPPVSQNLHAFVSW